MDDILNRIFSCVEAGKIDRGSPYPPAMRDQDGAFELTRLALDSGSRADDILEKALIPAMASVGSRFSRHEIFVPQMLMSAKAMSQAMGHLRPYFNSGEAKQRGTFIIGTVMGDLHDIGKNLVAMIIEGGGWEVIDLGVDVRPEKILQVLGDHPGAAVGLSALLTTTMVNMERTVREVKERYPSTRILVGGAPVTAGFCESIGADFYAPDPQGAVDWLASSHA